MEGLTVIYLGQLCELKIDFRKDVNEDGAEVAVAFVTPVPIEPTSIQRQDFESVLRTLGIRFGDNEFGHKVKEQMRLVWNARGVEDAKTLHKLKRTDAIQMLAENNV